MTPYTFLIWPSTGRMRKKAEITCEDCYFRRAYLCALPGNTPCPTFRSVKGALAPPRQASLVPRSQLRAHAAA
jgi:hypothetical protein